MAVRSVQEIWVDANFKETQLADLRIGQPADLYVDMYGGRRVFQGRVTGFTMGTGSTLALLPAAERDRELREGRPAAPGADRPGRRQPGGRPAVRRPVGHPLRLLQGAADRARRRPPAPGSRAGGTARRRHRAAAAGEPPATDGPAAVPPRARPGRRSNPWLIAVVVTVPTFMEVLDTSIANVALRYIAGGLSAAENDSEWVITSYLAANAVVLPLSGWLSATSRPAELLPRVGRPVHGQLGPLRDGDEPGAADPLPAAPGDRRRRAPADARRRCCSTPSRPRSRARR